MGKQYKNLEQQCVGDGLTIYLRETYPDAQLRHYGSPATIRWEEYGMEPQNLSGYFDNQSHYTKLAWMDHHSRIREYPPIQRQLDMIYWDKINGTNKWVETITEIKNSTPKNPEFVEPEPVEYYEPEEVFTFDGEKFTGTTTPASLELLQEMIDKHT